MKFKGSFDINETRDKVASLFADPASNKEYQDGFVSKELISGKDGEEGAVYKLFYKHGGREMEMTETITSNQLPEAYEASYYHIHMDNTMKYSFTPIEKDKTRFDYECEYTRINWFMPKLMAIFFPSIYRKQGEKWMRQFKEFVEKQ